MSTSEIKSEIQKIIEKLPENSLSVVLEYLKKLSAEAQRWQAEKYLLELNGRYSSLLSGLAK